MSSPHLWSLLPVRLVLYVIGLLGPLTIVPLPPVQAQSITPAIDGTGTQINAPDGNHFQITGGTQAGQNLFHSFHQFGLTQGQVANFIANPTVQNILGRVTGGNTSVINGLIQVSGSQANLFLMNPAGIVFGANASLNVPASFTATTANGIWVGGESEGWFSAIGPTNYANLTGSPNGFAFLSNPGSIVNAGNLTVNFGQSITLLGGSVINTGTIAAPGGTITIAAIPGEKLVQVSQAGSLLSLALPLEPRSQLSTAVPAPPSLPQLLTGGSVPEVTGITMDNGILRLTSSQASLPTESGTAIAAGTLTTSSPSATSSLIQVLGERVGVLGGVIDASGANGGTIRIGGDYRGQGTVPNAMQTVVSATSQIRADALERGKGGSAIVWADGATQFDGQISARGGLHGGDGGFVEVSGKTSLTFQGAADTSAPQGHTGTLLLDPTTINVITGTSFTGGAASLTDFVWGFTEDPGTQTIGTTNIQTLLGTNNVTLQATDTINWAGALDINGIGATGRSLTLQSNGRINFTGSITDSVAGGDSLHFVLNSNADGIGAGAIHINNANINTGGGSITLGGGSDPANHPAIGDVLGSDGAGIRIFGTSILNSGGGAISIRGEGFGGAQGEHGVLLEGSSQILSGGGTIAITGAGAGGGDFNIGIVQRGTAIVNSGDGNITYVGTGSTAPGSTNGNVGITIESGAQVLSGAGNISFTGVGGASGTDNRGIIQSALVQSTSGNITYIGSGGNGTDRNSGVLLSNNSRLSSNTGAIAITGTSDGTGNSNSGIALTGNAAVFTNGNIILSGTGGSGVNDNVGIGFLNTASVTTSNGNIQLTGVGGGTGIRPYGISFDHSPTVTATGSGDITMTGTAGNGGIFSVGIRAVDDTRIATSTGNLTLTGIGNGNGPQNQGLRIRNNAQLVANGAIALTGTPGSGTVEGITFDTSAAATNVGITGGAGAITLTADEINLNTLPGRIQGTGTLTLQPLTPTQAIAVGNGANVPGSLTLTTGDLAALADGFSTITLGRADSSGVVNVQAVTTTDPLTIRTPAGTGTIAFNGSINTTNNAINLLASNTITVNSAINAGTSTATLNATTINLNAPITAATVTGSTATTVNVSNSGVPATSGSIDNGVDVVAVNGTVNAAAGIYTEAITITKGLTLNGALTGNTVLSGGNTTRVLEVAGTGNVFLNRLTIQDGNGVSSGSGLLHSGTGSLTISDSAIANNRVSGTFNRGGGIFKDGTGTLNLIRTTITGNSSTTTGGGIYINNGSLTITDSTIANNTAAQAGGGIRSFSANASVTITNSTLSGNRSGTSGGAISHDGGSMTIRNSTITNNIADFGASNTGNGGGISNTSGNLSLGNSIVAGNSDQSTTIIHPDLSGTFSDLGTNLIGNSFGSTGLVNGSNGNLVGSTMTPINPLLAPLGNYGGPTQTHALLPGSPAIDAGNFSLTTPDQRGQARFGQADIGAVESQGFAIAALTGTTQSTTIDTPFGIPLSVRVTANQAVEPVAGGIISFVPPTSGASGSFSGSSIVTIDSHGVAIAPTFIANTTSGSYTVAVRANSITLAPFNLSNLDRVRPAVVQPVQPIPAQPTATTPVAVSTSSFSITRLNHLASDLQGEPIEIQEIHQAPITTVDLCIARRDFLPNVSIKLDLPDCQELEFGDGLNPLAK